MKRSVKKLLQIAERNGYDLIIARDSSGRVVLLTCCDVAIPNQMVPQMVPTFENYTLAARFLKEL